MVDRALLEQMKGLGAALIDERVADAKANPLDGRPWDQVQESLRERRSR